MRSIVRVARRQWLREQPREPPGASKSSSGQSARCGSRDARCRRPRSRRQSAAVAGSNKLRLFGGVAQLGERLLCKQEVDGSIPFTSTTDRTSEARSCRAATVVAQQPREPPGASRGSSGSSDRSGMNGAVRRSAEDREKQEFAESVKLEAIDL